MIVDPIDYERMNASVILFFKCLKKDDADMMVMWMLLRSIQN